MKKILMSLFVLGLFAFSFQAHASVLSDALLKIENLTKEITKLKIQLKSSVGDIILPGTSTGDTTPRIMFWPGAVNQHVDSDGIWRTDPDGASGGHPSTLYANDYGDRPVEYCNKFYSGITSVEEYKKETISTWRAGGNTGASAGTRMSYKCVGKNTDNIASWNVSSADYWTTVLSPKVVVVATPETIPDGGISTISWSSENTNECDTGGHGTETSGSFKTPRLATDTSYTVTCTASRMNGTVSDSAVVSVEKDTVPEIVAVTPKITVLSPNSGREAIESGNKVEIRWSSNISINSLVDVYVTDGTHRGKKVRTYNKGDSGLIYTLDSSLIPGSNYKACISLVAEDVAASDCSDYPFKIKSTTSVTPSLTVLSPNGGEVYKAGDKITVKWKSVGYSSDSKISIDLATKDSSGGSSNTFLMDISNLYDDGSETLIIPNNVKTGNNYVFAFTIFETSSKWQMAKSGTFTINSSDLTDDTPSITVLSPKGGEVYKAGDKITVKWNTENISADTRMFIRLDGDYTTYDKAINNGTTISKNDGYEVVTLPTDDTWPGMKFGKKYKISIQTYPDEETIGYSNSLFSVNSNVSTEDSILRILSPRGGENFVQGNLNKISWAGGTNIVKIALSNSSYKTSEDMGILGWIELNGKPNSSLTWDGMSVSDLAGDIHWNVVPGKYKIVVVSEDKNKNYCMGDLEGDCSFDFNDKTFTISSPDTTTTTTPTTGTTSPSSRTLKLGVKGDDVKELQEFLDLLADGSFGPKTRAKVIEWQKANGLTADGAFGNMSRQKAGLTE